MSCHFQKLAPVDAVTYMPFVAHHIVVLSTFKELSGLRGLACRVQIETFGRLLLLLYTRPKKKGISNVARTRGLGSNLPSPMKALWNVALVKKTPLLKYLNYL